MCITESESVWIISVFQLTFAAFLLISGRISDVYNPSKHTKKSGEVKKVFIGGVSALGILSVAAGFVNDKIPIIILRALIDIASAMTIPSGLALLVNVFPDPLHQAQALGVYGSCAAVANVLGFPIGAMFVQWTSFHCVFWFVGSIAIPVALASLFVIPPQIAKSANKPNVRIAKWKSLALIGVFILTVAIVLFIFALTCLVPLIMSVLMITGFFYWETVIPVDEAAMYDGRPLRMAVGSLILCLDLLARGSTTTSPSCLVWRCYHSSGGMFPSTVSLLCGKISSIGPPSRPLSTCKCLKLRKTVFSHTIRLPIGHRHSPSCSPSMAGTVGASFNGALEFGSAVGFAAVGSIETSVEATHGGPEEYHGRAAAFLFLLGIVSLEIISVSSLYQTKTDHLPQPKSDDTVYDNTAVQQSKGKTDKINDVNHGVKTSNSPV
ncbi:hypothetical protein PAXINDRAFT_172663 [Paxillus involutus ATCC 200175]|uniref:Major facilitator superfamily (MFS) profile domain-containing protein n=1 Tax=Paxillus involutus ATCC 200175 TaxID=664439 RepID=A0A0C9TMM1_PAXIN|nr:hypothetical protein PAXINDRAFT_172663 [Paxillus involutus ATCC 200175]